MSNCKEIWRFTYKFVIIHIVTYLVFGIIFMIVTDYFTIFSEHEFMSQVMRQQDSIWVRLAVLFQIPRGCLLALAVYPFRRVLYDKYGWVKLAFLLWVLTGIGAVITGPGSIEGFLYTNLGFGNPLIGLPEITLQVGVFSIVFVRWFIKRRDNVETSD